MCKTMVMKMSLATMLLMLISMKSFSQNIGVKSNLMYWATTTPNIGLETSVGKKHTAQVFVGFNPWKQSGGDQSSLRHWLVMPEYRIGSARTSMAGSSVLMLWVDSLMPEASSYLSVCLRTCATIAMRDGT